jgi:hypothetical protein
MANMSKHGEITAEIGKNFKLEGYDIFYDHGVPGENVGTIVSTIEKRYLRKDELGQLDIAIVEKDSDRAIALIEIEETNDRPKALLGDIFGVLMGEYIYFRRKQKISVNKHTALIVFGKSKVSDEKRNKYLRKKVMKMKSSLSTGNSKIGKVVIKTFADEKELSALLPSVLDKAFKGAL